MYRFSDIKPTHFHQEQSDASILNALGTTLVASHRAGIHTLRTLVDFFPSSLPIVVAHTAAPKPLHAPQIVSGTYPMLYRMLDEIIGLTKCEVFSYVPDM
jgi:hypothetical protein